ncbi:MAG: zeta toxin family protein [Candidatus Cryptobacteroides sp.]|jgi:predicted ABC-type ATPase|nr:AAA family ATPase [Rikenellaceae bacterium]
MPKLYILSGCNGSGKTTASYTLLPEMLECTEFVNSDEFAKSFSPFNPSEATIVASRFMLMRIEYLLSRKEDFSIETTLATRSLVGIINTAKAAGYSITLLYFWLSSPELAIQRVRNRVKAGGHNIPENVIRRRYIMGLQYFFETYIPLSDRWVLADNSTTPFKVVAEGSNNGTFIKDEEKYKTIRSIVYPDEQE